MQASKICGYTQGLTTNQTGAGLGQDLHSGFIILTDKKGRYRPLIIKPILLSTPRVNNVCAKLDFPLFQLSMISSLGFDHLT